MARIPPAAPKGTRDYLPRDLVRRNRVFTLLRETFERYGYEPLETPAVESTSVLEGKYGDEGERLLFRILKRGHDLESAAQRIAGETSAGGLSRHLADMALRYDLTVPFARVIAAHQSDVLLPFRRYQMQPVWRAERPQRGRYREFYQCDVDCVGSRSVTVEAELLAMVSEVFARIGFQDFTIKINHRALLAALMEGASVPEAQRTAALVAIDKLDKLGDAGVRAELATAGLEPATIERLMGALRVTGTPQEMLAGLEGTVGQTPSGALALGELRELFTYLPLFGVPA
ncbi:MAG TPA: HisS family protein, partial [Ktedonobacterales bacterium]